MPELDIIEQVTIEQLKKSKLQAIKTEMMQAFFKYFPIHDVEGGCVVLELSGEREQRGCGSRHSARQGGLLSGEG